VGGRGRGLEKRKGWGKGGVMTQTLYPHMNKRNFKKRLGIYEILYLPLYDREYTKINQDISN
jgi:hypothetical protein